VTGPGHDVPPSSHLCRKDPQPPLPRTRRLSQSVSRDPFCGSPSAPASTSQPPLLSHPSLSEMFARQACAAMNSFPPLAEHQSSQIIVSTGTPAVRSMSALSASGNSPTADFFSPERLRGAWQWIFDFPQTGRCFFATLSNGTPSPDRGIRALARSRDSRTLGHCPAVSPIRSFLFQI